MLDLPDNVENYSSTTTFTNDTVPKALLNEHNTKAGTWGLLTVEKGELKYVVTEPGYEEEVIVKSGDTAVIAPEHKHYVKPGDDSAFHVAFYR